MEIDKLKRSNFISQIFQERKEIRRLKDEDDKLKEFNRKLLIWTSALERAAGSANDVSISWINFGYVDPCIYDYESKYNRGMVILRLIGIGLNTLPDEIGYKLRSLNVLNISDNQLVSLPDSILQLSNLKELHLVHNKLQNLPERIGLLGSLIRLEIANNQLERLPVTLAGLTLIQRLDAESNKLKILPENLDIMKSCKILNFNRNQLTRLPRCLGRMLNLTTLSASWNQISYIPEELCSSKSILHIRLNLNQITLIPEKIGIMRQLIELSLDSNRITSFPMSFYQLTNLKVLRIESNPHLLNPSVDIICGGAEGVVHWCLERFRDSETSRMRYIIQKVISLLGQIEMRGIADPAYWEASVKIGDDEWFAFQLDYFWDTLLPKVENIWYQEVITGKQNLNELFAFPFSKADVGWAFAHFGDAYGPLLIKQKTDFKRCMCVDTNGKRVPCIPPRIGYMCNRYCTMIKSAIVLETDKARRNWIAYQKHSLEDAVKRAEHEALKYLTSTAGDLWLTIASFQKAEEIMNQKLAGRAVKNREKMIEKRKFHVVQKYESKLNIVRGVRDRKLKTFNDKIAGLRQELSVARPGYMSDRLQAKIATIVQQIKDISEHQIIVDLSQQCEREMNRVEDMLLNDYNSEDNDDNIDGEGSSESSDEEQGGNNGHKKKTAKKTPVRKSPKTYLPPPDPNQKIVDRLNQELQALSKSVNHAAISTIDAVKQADRHMRVAMDVADIRLHKLKFIIRGDFAEIQREMKHEMFTQYLGSAVATVRRRTEDSFRNIDMVRQALQGKDIAVLFQQWRDWVRTKRKRMKRDLRHELRLAVQNFDAALESVNIVDEYLQEWVQLEDLFTEKPYWQNVKTGQISMERPGYEHYLPITFRVPTPPKPLPEGISIESSSSEGEESDAETKGIATAATTKKKKSAEKKKHRGKKTAILKRSTVESEVTGDDDAGDELSGDDSDSAPLAEQEGITIEGEIQVSDSDDDESERSADTRSRGRLRSTAGAGAGARGLSARLEPTREGVDGDDDSEADRFSSPLTTQNLYQGRVENKYASNASLPTVTTARTGYFGGSFTFTSPFKRYNGESFYSMNENNASFYGLHVADSSPNLKESSTANVQFQYGPDQLRIQRGLYLKKSMQLVDDELITKPDPEKEIDPKIIEMRKRVEAANAFKATKEYQYHAKVKSAAIVVGNIPCEGVLEEIKEQKKLGTARETAVAERKIQKIVNRSQTNSVRHETYMKQLTRRGMSHEELQRAREIKVAEEIETAGNEMPVPEELLHFAGGDNRMTFVKGEQGMRLRNVIAHRALHVEKVLREEAVRKGLAAPKESTFYDREIGILFKDGLSSSSEDDEDEESKQKRIAKRLEEQKKLAAIRRKEEEKRAVESRRKQRALDRFHK